MSALFSSFEQDGKNLSHLLKKVKTQHGKGSQNIHENVQNVITQLLHNIRESRSHRCFVKESIVSLVKRIEGFLQDFIRLDPENEPKYKAAVKEIKVLEESLQQPSSAVAGRPALLHPPGDDHSSPDTDFEQEIGPWKDLPEQQRRILLSFLLFPADTEIKKRELIHCCIGMDLPTPEAEVERALAKLVAAGLIKRTMRNKKLYNRYKMPASVHSELISLQSELSDVSRVRSLSGYNIVCDKDNDSENVAPGIEALLNISQRKLEKLSKLENLKMLHLGCWANDPTIYIILVEDPEIAFKDLKKMEKVRFLSLEGVSGIVTLPESVYALKNLRVLDLRACHNLEVLLNGGISKLENLTHLDLSQCYLLDSVPQGVSSLIKLQVLKGFVVTEEEDDEHADHQNKKKKNKNKNKKKDKDNYGSACSFGDLSKLTCLRKLTVRTRRMNFPTKQDLGTLRVMKILVSLKIAWVGTKLIEVPVYDDEPEVNAVAFPVMLAKLELQAAPNEIAARLLGLISRCSSVNYRLSKLYIRGGKLKELKHVLVHVKLLRLRYLPLLETRGDEFNKLFPNLTRLEISECPKLIFFPSDQNFRIL